MATVRDKSGNADHIHDYQQQTFAGRVASSNNSAVVVPSDTAYLTDAVGNRGIAKSVFATTGGTIAYKNEAGMSATVTVANGNIAYVRATQILSTGTTAVDMVAYF